MSQEPTQEKRAYHRIPCTGDGDLIIRVWRIPAGDLVPREPKPGADAVTTPVDISAGGLGLLIAAGDLQQLRLDRGVPIGALVVRKDTRIIVHGEIRRATTRADGLVRLGISVRLAEESLERRRALVKFEALVATIRRIELEQLARFGTSEAKPL
jgi:hypothetical protein